MGPPPSSSCSHMVNSGSLVVLLVYKANQRVFSQGKKPQNTLLIRYNCSFYCNSARSPRMAAPRCDVQLCVQPSEYMVSQPEGRGPFEGRQIRKKKQHKTLPQRNCFVWNI